METLNVNASELMLVMTLANMFTFASAVKMIKAGTSLSTISIINAGAATHALAYRRECIAESSLKCD